MTKRYREQVQILGFAAGLRTRAGAGPGSSRPGSIEPAAPAAFVWRGSTYRVITVLGHWREDANYWAGGGIEIPQRDLWRVEARNGTPATGVYELVCEQDVWRLERVWD